MRRKTKLFLVKEPLLFSFKTVEERLNITEGLIRELVRQGELKAVNDSGIGRKGYYIRVDSLKTYCRANNRNLFQPDFRFTGRLYSLRHPPSRLKPFQEIYFYLAVTSHNEIMVRPFNIRPVWAAEMLDVSEGQIYQLIKEKKISAIKYNTDDLFIPYDKLQSYIEKYTLPEKDCVNL